MTEKKILHIDLDNAIVDFKYGIDRLSRKQKSRTKSVRIIHGAVIGSRGFIDSRTLLHEKTQSLRWKE